MTDLVVSAPAKHRHCILLSADVNYHRFAIALIKQITDAPPDMAVDICLVTEDDVVLPPALTDLPVRLCRITIDKGDMHFPQRSHVNFSGYVKLFAINALAQSYDRILYLDSDIAFSGADFSRLFDIALLPGHVLGAIRDRFHQMRPHRLPADAAKLQLDYYPCFNSGVMLVDTKAWLGQDMLPRLLETVRTYGHGFTYTDQSALNLTLRGAWSELSWKWNWIYASLVARHMDAVSPVFIHFAGPTKPWHGTITGYPSKYVDWYTTFLATYYPDTQISSAASPSARRKKRLVRTFIRNQQAKPHLRAYRDRVSAPYDVHDPWT